MERSFIPGSKWLYIKIYTGNKSADELIINHIYPILESLQERKLIVGYFFIRYNDPKFHLRIRMLIESPSVIGEIYESLNKILIPMINNRCIWKVQNDTYQREIERYGETTIELAEQWFCVDSRRILELLNAIEANEHRWQIALLLIDDTLNQFQYNIQSKSKLLSLISSSFKQEFGMIKSYYTKQLNDKYRNKRKLIENTMDKKINVNFTNIINKYSPINHSLAEKINSLIKHDDKSYTNFLLSIIHMTMNRLFRTQNRLYELVIYDFLYRYYQSNIAKQKYEAI